MEISSTTTAGQELAVNKAQVGNENLQRTPAKADESRQSGQSPERPEPQRVTGVDEQRIDIYA